LRRVIHIAAVFVAVSLIAAMFAQSSFACPACFAATPGGGLRAYIASTIFLSILPFALVAMVAGFVYFKRSLRANRFTSPSETSARIR